MVQTAMDFAPGFPSTSTSGTVSRFALEASATVWWVFDQVSEALSTISASTSTPDWITGKRREVALNLVMDIL